MGRHRCPSFFLRAVVPGFFWAPTVVSERVPEDHSIQTIRYVNELMGNVPFSATTATATCLLYDVTEKNTDVCPFYAYFLIRI